MDYRYEAGAFSLKNTLECGQCFRWSIQPDGSYCGIAGGHRLRLRQDGSILTFFDTTGEEFDRIWRKYFDFDTDYPGIYRSLCKDAVIRQAYEYTGEIHILRQEPWEGLCSFIISQNNNIPRITGIIDRLCCNFGEQLPGGGFSFPSAERLAVLEPEDLSVLRAGFRVRYILDAARKVADGRIDFGRIASEDLETARQELRQICGVGPKVAECALLFGLYRLEAFPVDVWMKRVLKWFYQTGFPEEAKPYGGIAQQVLFHYVRCCAYAVPEEMQH